MGMTALPVAVPDLGSGRRRLLAAGAVMAFLPSIALADGGGPIFILAGPVLFLVAQAWILAIEVLVLKRLITPLRWGEAAIDVLVANLRSYLLVGILLPIATTVGGLALAGAVEGLLRWAGSPAAGPASELIMGFTGMVVDSRWIALALPYGVVTWFVVTFFLSVRVESKSLQRRWQDRGFDSPVSPARASWIVNGASYAGLSIGIIWMVLEMR